MRLLDGLSLVCLAEELLYVSLNVDCEEPPAVALEGNSIWPDEELLKVPGDVVPADWTPNYKTGVSHQGDWVITGEWELFLEELEQGMGILPIHIHLLQELKLWLKAISWTDMLQGQKDFLIPAVLLHRLIKRFFIK